MATKKLTDLVVTAAMVSVRRADDSIVYLYRGTPLPSGLAEGEAKRLADLDMVGETAVPVVAEPPRSTARINGRGRAPAAAPTASAATATKKATVKTAAEKAVEKAAAEKAAAAVAAAAQADGAADGNDGDGGADGADGSKD